MTSAQLARRLGVAQSRIPALERAEAKQTLTLASLEKAAHALDCRLVYALVPRKSLDELVEARARRKAKQRLASTGHSMALEAQSVEAADEHAQLEHLIRRLIENAGAELWEDDE